MARTPTGTIVARTGRDGRTYRGLRFTAYGKRRYLSLGPVTADVAERELRHVLADVERGAWMPPLAVDPPPEPVPMFHAFAEDWWNRNAGQLAANTQADYRWRLEVHLLPHFGAMTLETITYNDVESYLAAKLAESERRRVAIAAKEPLRDDDGNVLRAFKASTVNKTVKLMAQILDGAVDRDLIARNPARGKARRVRERAPRRTYIDTGEQITALLDAAGRLDAEAQPGARHTTRRAILATLVFAGLRIGELCELRWRDVDLASGWLHVDDAKTDAGRRKVKIRGALRDALVTVRADAQRTAPADYVFATRTGKKPSHENIRTRVLKKAVTAANVKLVKDGSTPLPEGITPHSCRRTFASVLYALGENPAVVMAEMGHTDPALALRIYAQAMRRDDQEIKQLRALVDALNWH